jgi:hypothetical protein
MILYVNGDSHTAAAEAVNPYGWACDDHRYFYLGRNAHPDNLAVSWSKRLSDVLKMGLHCDAEAGCSNTRIRRSTIEFLDQIPDAADRYFVIIQWSTWERQEWLIDREWYQIGASGTDSVPESHSDQYKEFVSSVDWTRVTQQEHDKIWEFHQELSKKGIRHLFFNGDNHFGSLQSRLAWDPAIYIDPYNPEMTYSSWLRRHGFETVSPKSWHFGQDAHGAWARFMLKYITTNQLIS